MHHTSICLMFSDLFLLHYIGMKLSLTVEIPPSEFSRAPVCSLRAYYNLGAKRLCSAGRSRPEVAATNPAQDWGKEIPLYSRLPRLPQRFSKTSARKQARLRGCEEAAACVSSPHSSAKPPPGKPAPQGCPRFLGLGEGPRATGRVGRCPDPPPTQSALDVTREFPPRHAPPPAAKRGGSPALL